MSLEKLKKVRLGPDTDTWINPEDIVEIGRWKQDDEIKTRIHMKDGRKWWPSAGITSDQVMADLLGESGVAEAVSRLRAEVQKLEAVRAELVQQIAEMKAEKAEHGLAFVDANGGLALTDAAALSILPRRSMRNAIHNSALAGLMVVFGMIGAALAVAAVVS